MRDVLENSHFEGQLKPNIKIDLREISCAGWEVDRTGSGSCPVVAFSVTGFEPLYFTTRELGCKERKQQAS
jgi:hypothetical protein